MQRHNTEKMIQHFPADLCWLSNHALRKLECGPFHRQKEGSYKVPLFDSSNCFVVLKSFPLSISLSKPLKPK